MVKINIREVGDGRKPSPGLGKLLLFLALVFAAESVTAVAIPLVGAAADPTPVLADTSGAMSASPPAPHSSPFATTVMCVEELDRPRCSRYFADLLRRAPLNEAEEKAGRSAQQRIDAVMPPGREEPCEHYYADYSCSGDVLPPTAGQVRRALDKAGFRTAVIRAARDPDPAPVGSLLLAVSIGRACVLSYYDSGTDSQSWTTGQLPDGLCLNL